MLLNKDSIQLWGGLECTINRIGDQFFDQLEYSGHYGRPTDIDNFANLGIKALRYPVLWERHEPVKNDTINWTFTNNSLKKIRDLGMVPVVGLLHHGSGPMFTNLLAADFAEDLASYAGKVARQFPWLEYYTPVNEPLTTARFSGLYGLWYPHLKSDIGFVKMLINQLKGIVLSMHAIRKVNPKAKLVQTEDLSKTYSTAFLSFQAAFENERRWLTYDMLCGKLRPGAKMYEHFLRLGIADDDLRFFIDNPCPPDMMGLNYYITSERYLDEKLENYPSYTHGGNELQHYADVEAIRVEHGNDWGLEVLLREAWQRFHLPLAITENHINCTREEQLRWFRESWGSLQQVKNEGVDVRALTAWSLLGSFGWDKLLTDQKMTYEPGVFDIRSGIPRPTALATELRCAVNSEPAHCLACTPGWWHQESSIGSIKKTAGEGRLKPILIFGKTGTLGLALARTCSRRNIHYSLAGRLEVDITDLLQLEILIQKIKPWAIINAAGFVDIDRAESETTKCYAVNTAAPVLMAVLCEKYAIKFLTFSTDQVFDGTKAERYNENDPVNPLNVYGSSKAMAEAQVMALNAGALVIRTSSFFGPWDKANFAEAVIHSLLQSQSFNAASDIFTSPTYVPDLADASLDLLIDDEKGIWHLSTSASISWARFAKQLADEFGYNPALIRPVSSKDMNWIAQRPANASFTTLKGAILPSLENAIRRFVSDRQATPAFLMV